MGASQEKQITCISLNYSGILKSPFQYVVLEHEKEQMQLDRYFIALMKLHFKEPTLQKYKWELGKIDQKMQKERYSPLYDPNVGILEQRLVDELQFYSKWQEVFKRACEQMDPQNKLNITPEQHQHAKLFDFLCYKTLALYSNEVAEADFASINISQLKVQLYAKTMKKFFNAAYLDEGLKVARTFKAMNQQDVEVLFLQEVSPEFLLEVEKDKKYAVFKRQGTDSAILIKAKLINQGEWERTTNRIRAIGQTFDEKLNWNNDSTILIADNVILICAHLSSKKDKNQEQIKQMTGDLLRLAAIYPQKSIVMGLDANSFLGNKLGEKFIIYPDDEKTHTTFKKRTFLQPQTHKANQIASSCRDHLVFCKSRYLQVSKDLKEPKVCTIQNNVNIDKMMIPTDEHPFDHFVVSVKASLKFN